MSSTAANYPQHAQHWNYAGVKEKRLQQEPEVSLCKILPITQDNCKQRTQFPTYLDRTRVVSSDERIPPCSIHDLIQHVPFFFLDGECIYQNSCVCGA